tara:strand:- start:2120 stop:2563 length:444 start_codon:yes stop_codon:yes gene_type:complete
MPDEKLTPSVLYTIEAEESKKKLQAELDVPDPELSVAEEILANNTKRIPKTEKRNRPDEHSDLYTDEDPKGTITGLGFKDKQTALESIRKINKSNRKHAHKVQAMLVMIQRLKVAIKRTKDKSKLKNLRESLEVYEPAFEKLKNSKK